MVEEIIPQSSEIFRRSRINEHGRTHGAYRDWLSDKDGQEALAKQALAKPSELTRKELEGMSVRELELLEIDTILGLLKSPDAQEAIEQGRMTLGLIKPAVDEGVNFPKHVRSDHRSAQYLVEEIIEPAWVPDGVLVQFAVPLSQDQARILYAEHTDKGFFESLVEYTASGPVTFLILYDQSGRAVERWRHIMGSTDPKKANFESIRGTHAPSMEHNLVHGSDSVESAKREIGLFVEVLEDWREFLGENNPSEIKLLEPVEDLTNE